MRWSENITMPQIDDQHLRIVSETIKVPLNEIQ